MPVTIVGGSTRVVDADGLTIDELAGNVATSSDTISIALVKAKAGTSEPWLTLHYDEWIAVLKGKVVLALPDDKGEVEVPEGKTVHIAPGTRFRPTFPVDTEYVPVCLPAFRPDRCIREDVTEAGEAIAAKLHELHGAGATMACTPSADDAKPEVLFHMTTKASWDAAKKSKKAYYPPTFEVDGHYTHATGVPSRLITTANHFYQVSGEKRNAVVLYSAQRAVVLQAAAHSHQKPCPASPYTRTLRASGCASRSRARPCAMLASSCATSRRCLLGTSRSARSGLSGFARMS